MNSISEISTRKYYTPETLQHPFISKIKNAIRWMIHERGGFAKIVGSILVPSQYLGPSVLKSNTIVEEFDRDLGMNGVKQMERIELSLGEGRTLRGIILYPVESTGKMSKCIVYNNPNGITVPEFLTYSQYNGNVPFQLMNKMQCPIILYDYYGTGISRSAHGSREGFQSFSFIERPSAYTISQDGLAILEYAMERFSQVDIWGSSLGGGVATIVCERYLNKHPQDTHRLRLFNHDSFTTTGKVVLPAYLSGIATLAGANLDAESSIYKLGKRGLPITILCHNKDPIIPPGARMAEIAHKITGKVTLIESPSHQHAALTADMVRQLD